MKPIATVRDKFGNELVTFKRPKWITVDDILFFYMKKNTDGSVSQTVNIYHHESGNWCGWEDHNEDVEDYLNRHIEEIKERIKRWKVSK